ncbi:MAG TPA: RyR domain-containing protein [Thermoguttaceae bacterium]|nr:RyR domain-containing protein [Thermoguttaceae bacterium]
MAADHDLEMVEFERQVDEYTQTRFVYEVFAEVLERLLSRAVKGLDVRGIVEARAKAIPSFAEKIIRKRYSDPMTQMTDLCGARVITEHRDEIDRVRDYVRRHFEIHTSEDVLERLSVGEFGYLSVHLIVSMREGQFGDLAETLFRAECEGPNGDAFRDALSRLDERRTPEQCQETSLAPGPKFKAEIQVRTLLQHAWAAFGHDRLYKSEFEVPRRWRRDANRIAAALEEADEGIGRTIRGVERYRSYYGSYMTRAQREAERRKLEAVFRYDSDNRRLAHRIARLAISLQDYPRAETALEKFVRAWEGSPAADALKAAVATIRSQPLEDGDPQYLDEREKAERELLRLRDPEMASVLADYGRTRSQTGQADGRDYLLWAFGLNRDTIDALVFLAYTYEDSDHQTELEYFEEAFETDPSDPQALEGFVYCKLRSGTDGGFLSAIRQSLENATARCREYAEVGIDVPRVYYQMGFFSLLLKRPNDALEAYAKAVETSDSPDPVEERLKRIHRLKRALRNPPPEIGWVRRFLRAAVVAKSWQLQHDAEAHQRRRDSEVSELEEQREQLAKQADESKTREKIDQTTEKLEAARQACQETDQQLQHARERVAASREERLKRCVCARLEPLVEPIVLVAGGCDVDVTAKMKEYEILMRTAFSAFRGTVFSAGTESGIGILVGDLPASIHGPFAKIAYVPAAVPTWTSLHEAYKIHNTTGTRFSVLEPIQNWIDLLAAGADPAQVKLLGINGGKISAFEFRMALAFGAKVGILRDSGREAGALLQDERWSGSPKLMGLPNDPQTVKAFVEDLPKSESLRDEDREDLARRTHEEYRRGRGRDLAKKDPALADWEHLPPDLQHSNRQQIDHIEEKLRAVGLRIRKRKPEKVQLYKFSKDQIRTMAEMEHARWNVERLLNGWRLGERDAEKKTTPYLVAWDDLPDDIKRYDVEAVERIPEMLKGYGYEVVPK